MENLAPGQRWNYLARAEDVESSVTILKIEQAPDSSKIYHISIDNIQVKSADKNENSSIHFAHLPVSIETLQNSLTTLKETIEPAELPEGYYLWLEKFRKGEAGIFNISLTQVVESLITPIVNPLPMLPDIREVAKWDAVTIDKSEAYSFVSTGHQIITLIRNDNYEAFSVLIWFEKAYAYVTFLEGTRYESGGLVTPEDCVNGLQALSAILEKSELHTFFLRLSTDPSQCEPPINLEDHKRLSERFSLIFKMNGDPRICKAHHALTNHPQSIQLLRKFWLENENNVAKSIDDRFKLVWCRYNALDIRYRVAAESLLNAILPYTRDQSGNIQTKDVISAVASIVAEQCQRLVGEFTLDGHPYFPGQIVFSEKISELIFGESDRDVRPYGSVWEMIAELLPSAEASIYRLPDPSSILRTFAAHCANMGFWGRVPLASIADQPIHLPLKIAYLAREQMNTLLKPFELASGEQLYISAVALTYAILSCESTFNLSLSLELAFETINGMAKTAPMNDALLRQFPWDLAESRIDRGNIMVLGLSEPVAPEMIN